MAGYSRSQKRPTNSGKFGARAKAMQKRQVNTSPKTQQQQRKAKKKGPPNAPRNTVAPPMQSGQMVRARIPRTDRLFDAFSNTNPLPDSMTFGHFTPCRSYYSFGITTAWLEAVPAANTVTQTVTPVSTPSDICMWFNWQPSGMTALMFQASDKHSQFIMVGAPQFFPSTSVSNTLTYASGTPQQIRPMRTSIRISCTTTEINRAGGVTSIIVPQNITLPAGNTQTGVYSYGTAANALAPTTTAYYGAISPGGISSILKLLNGSGSSFASATTLANETKQWDLTPSSYVGFHTYQNWQQVATIDASPSTLSSVSILSTQTASVLNNLATNVDVLAFVGDDALNVCNALFLFRGKDLPVQSYQVEVAHMVAARFPANTLLANGSILPRKDPSNRVSDSATEIQAGGSGGRTVGRNGPRGKNTVVM